VEDKSLECSVNDELHSGAAAAAAELGGAVVDERTDVIRMLKQRHLLLTV